MEDPEGGKKPQSDGALAAGRKDGKKSRRRKGKRGGQSRSATHPASHDLAGNAGGAARPLENEPGSPARKRKRRRRAVHGGPADAVAQPHPVAERPPAPEQAPRADGDSAPSRRNRRKHRGKRGLQGRPLTTEKVAGKPSAPSHQDTRPAPSARANVPPHDHQDDRHAQRARPAEREQDRGGDAGWPEELYAALDLGTNNCRLLIAQPTRPGQFRVVDAFSRIVRLGEGLAASGRLSEEAMDRAIEALRICASKLRNREIRRMRLIATEACRQAVNGEEFLSRVVAETGLELEIIDRETEARLPVKLVSG